MFDRLLQSIASLLLRIETAEVTFSRRGFLTTTSAAQGRLESVGKNFLRGYHAALRDADPNRLAEVLESIEQADRGFAYEGAAMALALLDQILPSRRNRWQQLLSGPGSAHLYMLHVGYGWALARVPWLRQNPERQLARFHPLWRWLVVDGYGFHEGYFHARRYVSTSRLPPKLTGYARRAFDQGLGRSLWFLGGADAENVAQLVSSFDKRRQADLWSGVGLGCAYAGGADKSFLAALRQAAGAYESCLAQGAAFAAKARQHAGNPASHTASACEQWCGMDADAAAALTDECVAGLSGNESEPAFELWRRRIQSRLQLALAASA
jgi:enediyne biosynthesis protein E3